MKKDNFIKALCVYVVAFLLLVLGFQGRAEDAAKTPTSTTTEDKADTKEKSKKTADKKDSKKSKSADTKEKGSGEMFALFETNKGTFKIKLHADKTPKTVENFVDLAEGKKAWTDPKTGKKMNTPLYDGLTFHRVIPNFMIQGGDPKGDGTGSPIEKFKDEFVPELTHSKPGILSMANAGPNTNGSQFFITVAATPWLDGKLDPMTKQWKGHTVFGEVVEGMDVVMGISMVKTLPGDRPAEPVVIKHIKIQR